jgi:predicted DNA-binding transcriptional regulator AlpA
MDENHNRPPRYAGRLLYCREDLFSLGLRLSNSSMLRMEAAGTLPKRVYIGPHSVAWVADEIDTYIAALAASREETA